VGVQVRHQGAHPEKRPYKDHDALEVREERCNAATALATVNGNEIRDEEPLSNIGWEGAESR
jgi:hypothetical protein